MFRDRLVSRIGDALRAAAARIDRLDAEVLLAHSLGVDRMALLLAPDRAVDAVAFAALVDRRAAGEPVAYITGHREFWSLDLAVTPDVLIPRPDSETLIAAAVDHFAGSAGPARVLDLGTGSGALLLAALSEWPAATGVGVDASAAALAVARGNALRLGSGDRATFVHGGWDAGQGAFDLVLCNPPYVAVGETLPRDVADWEPPAALFAGADGLDDYRAVAPVVAARLAPGGIGCIEIGATQAAAVTALFVAAGLTVALRRDLAGLPRCLAVTN
jgi:release factor glutamine methyltransferase